MEKYSEQLGSPLLYVSRLEIRQFLIFSLVSRSLKIRWLELKSGS
ncbi:hypothetical protein ACQ4M4_13595 [Leptolyngbya sp. AN02str]